MVAVFPQSVSDSCWEVLLGCLCTREKVGVAKREMRRAGNDDNNNDGNDGNDNAIHH